MDLSVVHAYINSGLGIRPEPRQFRRAAVGPLLLVLLMGIIPGCVLGKGWLVLSIVMVVSATILFVVILGLSRRNMSVENRLIMQAIIYSNWVSQVILIQVMYYTMAWGVDLTLVLICIMPIVVPLIIGLRNSRSLRYQEKYTARATKNSQAAMFFGWTGVVGACVGKHFFSNVSNSVAIVFVIISLTMMACVFSFGLLAYQRLYYLKKYVTRS